MLFLLSLNFSYINVFGVASGSGKGRANRQRNLQRTPCQERHTAHCVFPWMATSTPGSCGRLPTPLLRPSTVVAPLDVPASLIFCLAATSFSSLGSGTLNSSQYSTSASLKFWEVLVIRKVHVGNEINTSKEFYPISNKHTHTQSYFPQLYCKVFEAMGHS